MSNLLIDDYPIMFLPELAKELGNPNDALILQQVEYWCNHNRKAKKYATHYIDGHWWTHNTYEEWGNQFVWLKISGIRKILKRLRDDGYLIAIQASSTDRTLWYRVNKEKTNELDAEIKRERAEKDASHSHVLQRSTSNEHDSTGLHLLQRDTYTYTETNTETKAEDSIASSSDLNSNTRYDGVKTLPPTKGDAENKSYNLLMVACDEIKCDLSKQKDVDYLRVLYNSLPSDNTQAVQAIKDFVSWWLDEEKKGKPPTVGQVAGFWPQFKEWQVDSMTTYHLLKPLTELKRKDSTVAVNLLRSDDYKTVKAIMRANNIGDIRALEYETEESWKSKEKKWRKAND